MSVMIDTGNYIAAKAAIMAKPAVVAAYPITPQTTLVEGIAKYASTGEYKGEYICVESEHSAMSACIGASATGVRTFTATSSHGLLLMHEMVHWAALARLPVIMCNINRVIGPGWNIWTDGKNVNEYHISRARVFPGDLFDWVKDEKYTLIVSNPPFHTGRAVDTLAAETFIKQTPGQLIVNGSLLIVANKFIRYDRLMKQSFGRVDIIAETSKYHLIRATTPSISP